MIMRFVIALVFAAPLFAQTCTYVVTPSSFNISADATPGLTVKVTVAPGSVCDGNYIATTTVPWLHITSSGGTLGSDVVFAADQNVGAGARSGVLTVALQTVIVTQAAAVCSFGLTPTTQNIPVAGGDATFKVASTCSFQAVSNVPWITVPANGVPDVPVTYTAAKNTCVSSRNGTITIQTSQPKPPTLAVTQDGSPDNISLSAYNATAGAAASNGRITVTTGDVCGWNAVPDVSWIQITNGTTSGTGSGGISYHLLENTAAVRVGSINVGNLRYTITQSGPAQASVVLTSVTNAASYNSDAVSPGEIVALFGDNMGPASIVTLQVIDGKVANSLAGTQVLFDGVAAPMIYTLKGQVSAVVPYGVAGQPSTKVQVKYGEMLSNTVTIPVRSATPGIFSMDSTGVGPGAILNQDTTPNTTGNRAAPLSIIAVYCTGGGVTNPASTDGEVIAGPLRQLVQTPVVTIGGLPAVVKFAGAAPGAVAGLTQINVEIPANAPSAIAAPVIIKLGDSVSTAGVTVAVK